MAKSPKLSPQARRRAIKLDRAEEYKEWIRGYRADHLCIDDIQKLKPGDVLDVAIFDRNMEEYGMWAEIPANTPFPADEFFRFNHHKIKIMENGCWELQMNSEKFQHPIHYNTESYATRWTWVVPSGKDNKVIELQRKGKGQKLRVFKLAIKDMFPLTRIGWRGPVMLWKYVKESTIPVYWDDA